MRNYSDFRKMLAGLLLTAVLGLTACGQKAEIPVEDFMKEERDVYKRQVKVSIRWRTASSQR